MQGSLSSDFYFYLGKFIFIQGNLFLSREYNVYLGKFIYFLGYLRVHYLGGCSSIQGTLGSLRCPNRVSKDIVGTLDNFVGTLDNVIQGPYLGPQITLSRALHNLSRVQKYPTEVDYRQYIYSICIIWLVILAIGCFLVSQK